MRTIKQGDQTMMWDPFCPSTDICISIVHIVVHSLTATAHYYKQASTTAVVLLPVYTTAAVQFMKNEDGSVIPPWDHKQVHVYSYIKVYRGPIFLPILVGLRTS